MAGPNYAGIAVGGVTHVGLTPIKHKQMWLIQHKIKKVAKGKKIHIPFDTKENQYNIGTGIADLKNKAPKTFKYLQEELKKLENNQ